LPLLKPGKSLRFALVTGAKDPDDLIREQGRDAMRTVLETARPLLETLWQRLVSGRDLTTPERRAALDREVYELCGQITDRSVQEHYKQALKERLWALFHPQRGGAGGSGGGSGRGFSGGGRGAAGGGRPPGRWVKGKWQAERPSLGKVGVGVGLSVQKSESLHHRILLATLIGHPQLADAVAERLGALDFDDVGLDRLRRAVLALVGEGEALDSEALKAHLRSQGHGEGLDALLRSTVFTHAAFARPDADPQDALQGWEHTQGSDG
jgi:DNA primase